jgi:phage-related protein
MNEQLKIIISAEIDKFKKNIEQAISSIKKTGEEANKSTKTVKSFTESFSEQEKELKELKVAYINIASAQGESSAEAIECANKIKALSAEFAKNKTKIKELAQAADGLDSSIEDVGDSAEEAEEKTEVSFDGISGVIKGAMKAAAAAVAGAATALVALAASTAEYRNEQAKLATAFEAAGSDAETAKETYNDLYRVLGDGGKATEAAAHLAKLTTNEKELSEWTNICQGVYATFGDSLPIEGLAEAANETAKVGTVTGGLADAPNWAGISEDEFNEKLAACNDEAEREKLIRETLNSVYDDAAKKYEENNKDIIAQNESQAKLDETTAKLGKTMQPLITAFTNLASEALAEVAPYLEDFANSLFPALEKVMSGISKALSSTFKWISKNKTVMATMAGIIGGIVAAITLYNTVAAIKAAMDAAQVTTVWGLVAAHIAQAAAAMAALAPYLLIVAAIAAIIAIIVLCIKYWDEIVAAVKIAIDYIVEFLTGLWDKFVEIWDSFIGMLAGVADWIFETVIKPILDFFVGLWEGIVSTFHTVIDPWVEIIKRASKIVYDSVIKPILDYFKKLWNDIKAVFAVVGNWFNNTVVQPVVKYFKGMWNGLTDGAKAAWEGIKKAFSSVGTWFKDIFSAAWQKVKDVFSTGGKIFSGIKEGIENTFKTVVNGLIDGINKIITIPFKAINSALSTLKGIEILEIKPFDWIETFDIPQIPKLAKGGIVDSATLAVVGEQGKEAVMPLENNTEWIDMLAARLSTAIGGGNTPIVLQVDGKTFAEISVDNINKLTKQRGKLPLVIA